jgi:5-methyltetrahydropteroyltriglutamate--homocysteine methyltransferase
MQVRWKVLQLQKKKKFRFIFCNGRGAQKRQDVIAMEMTKWFDTNYHYIVPEFTKSKFQFVFRKIIDEYKEENSWIPNKTCNHRPVSYLLLGKEKQEGFHRTHQQTTSYLF